LLSNVIPGTEAELRAHGAYDPFDFAILSRHVGYAKPDPEIYRLALDALPGINPEEIVFLDDQEHCLQPAQALGMQTILVQNPAQAIADIHRLLQN
jgi:putative hydrolase of the HAD superfamily